MKRFFSTYTLLLLNLIFVTSISCKKDAPKPVENLPPVKLRISRFEKEFHTLRPGDFPALKKKYPYFFPPSKSDEEWVQYPKDSLWNALYEQTDSVFKDFSGIEKSLTRVFQHVKYHYPKFRVPHVITMISLLDTDYQVIYKDSLMILSLDTFLGKDNVFYSNLPSYLRLQYEPSQIPVAAARAIAVETAPRIPYRRFIDRMIAAGKIQYATHTFIPWISEEELFRYSPEKMQWAKQNEKHIWSYFIDNEMLFDTDKELATRFIDKAPFSKFYKAFDAESPGRIGEWIGYHIIQSYMEHNKADLPRLMATPPDVIYKKSHYKPNK